MEKGTHREGPKIRMETPSRKSGVQVRDDIHFFLRSQEVTGTKPT